LKLEGGIGIKFAMAVLALLFFAGAAHADSTTYSYVGNPLDSPGSWVNQTLCTCNITGEMTFAQPLDLPTDIQDTTGTPTLPVSAFIRHL
jgi:hypothetical protein